VGKFEDLGVRKEFVKGLKELNIINPTEIQEKAIPLLISKSGDLVGQAQTGTGKTAAFGLPLLHKIDTKSKKVQALILCPTRELGQQVAKQLFKFTKYSDRIFTEAVYGGENIEIQIGKLKRPTHIIVATPGRLLDLIRRKAVDIRQVKTIVLDEADEMLSMGFKEELEAILTGIKSAESRWLFSATISKDINDIIYNYLSRSAHRIAIASENVVNQNIKHEFLACKDADKLENILAYLSSQDESRGVIFCKTKAETQKLAEQLKSKGVSADAINGDLKQKERDKVMRAFKNESLQVLIATDLAARGIDIEDLAYVAHYSMPDKAEYYTHRSGRTARAGKTGTSISFVNNKELKSLKIFQKELGFKLNDLG